MRLLLCLFLLSFTYKANAINFSVNYFSNYQYSYFNYLAYMDKAHCQYSYNGYWGYQYYHKSLGYYNLCQGKIYKQNFYIQVRNPDSSSSLCFIPTTQSASTSTYVGEPRCAYITSRYKQYKITTFKNRVGYTHLPINSVMVMKDRLNFYGAPFYQYLLNPDAYLFCMQWLAQTGDASYCYAFNQKGDFVHHQF